MANLDSVTIVDIISGEQVRATPEETEAVQPFAQSLLSAYGYPKEHIRTRPQWRVSRSPSDKSRPYPVDIVVFNDANQETDNEYIVVECKRKTRRDGRTQLQRYMSFCSANLGVWYNGRDHLFLLKTVTDGRLEFKEIPNLHSMGKA